MVSTEFRVPRRRYAPPPRSAGRRGRFQAPREQCW